MDKYGSGDPPLIHLSNIKNVKIALFIGAQDPFACVESCDWLKKELVDNVIHSQVIENCDHASFNFGKESNYLFDVLHLLATHNPISAYLRSEVVFRKYEECWGGGGRIDLEEMKKILEE